MPLNTDGYYTDPTYDSLRYADDGVMNANEVPFVVLSTPFDWLWRLGIALGDYAAVLFRRRLTYPVFADLGPYNKFGEGSIELFRRLGQERLYPGGQIMDVGMRDVVTVVFPGLGEGQGHFASQSALVADIQAVGRARFIALGGLPDA